MLHDLTSDSHQNILFLAAVDIHHNVAHLCPQKTRGWHLLILATCLAQSNLHSKNDDIIKLSPAGIARLGRKIWHNECHGSREQLTWWKDGEEFASLGIGHFIWHPRNYHGPFVQQFPALITFLKKRGVKIPAWLTKTPLCPWPSKHAFFKDFKSPRMQELRALLAATINLQAQFIVEHFQQSLRNVFKRLQQQAALCAHLAKQLKRFAHHPQGIYTLVDYANFKGIGIDDQEAYNHQGWGLLDILMRMKGTQPGFPAVKEFAHNANRALMLRVKNAPPERHEEQWLKGWFNRINTYTTP